MREISERSRKEVISGYFTTKILAHGKGGGDCNSYRVKACTWRGHVSERSPENVRRGTMSEGGNRLGRRKY